MEQKILRLRGCRQHNLKNISLDIPCQKIVVITGVSGSGKSSLAFDTIFAEGQRRYLEYLSLKTRSLIKQLPKPAVDLVEGLSPALAIGQGKQTLYSRGTVATYTDIYDFLALLFANLGEQHSPSTGKRLIRYTRQEIIHLLLTEYPEGTRLQLLAPIKLNREPPEEAIKRLQQMGFIRLQLNGQEWLSDSPLPPLDASTQLDVVVDRVEIKEGIRERLSSSVETAMDLSQGILKIQQGRQGEIRYLTEIYICPETSLSFAPLKPNDFNFNSPQGACPICQGQGGQEQVNPDLPNSPSAQWLICPACHGGRLKPESLACLIRGKNIHQLCLLTVLDLIHEIEQWSFQGKEALITQEILPSIQKRLQFLKQAGLDYIQLTRQGKTLSDGEAQRIQLASQIGAKLSGILYVLDEPSLGLHRQDIQALYQIIEELKELGNTVLLIEHEKSLIQQAEHIIELGPGAGIHGGELIFQGSYEELLKDKKSLTGRWLSGKLSFPLPPKRQHSQHLDVNHASLHNLQDFSVQIPLGCLVGFCGVSGSGKSTLALDLIGEEIYQAIYHSTPSKHLSGYESFKRLVISEKQSERLSPRSIPATYVEIMTPLRQLFASTRLAKARGYTTSRFSLNKRGGRCEACEGLGQIRVSMQWMPDLLVPCEVCQGARYNYETLQITWENRNIAEILALSVEEAFPLFQYIPGIGFKLELMKELGLEYLALGQPFNTLSSGEIQRLRLVADLASKSLETTLYILDEPSAGLHFQDIEKLIKILHRLVDKGHSIFMIEHHLDLLRQADWLIELGPGGGPNGGRLIFEGTPRQLMRSDTPTGRVF